MKDFKLVSDPLYERNTDIDSVRGFLEHSFRLYGDKKFCKYTVNNELRTKTYHELEMNVKRFGTYLDSKVSGTRHIALIGKTDFEWISAYFAMLYYNIVFIPLDRLLSREELLKQVDFADAEMLIYGDGYKDIARFISENSTVCGKYMALEGLCELTASMSDEDIKAPSTRPATNDMIELIYTSGTTDIGKAVMLSHNNVLKTLLYGIRLVDARPEETVLSLMPNNHTYELNIGLLMPVYFGMTVAIYDNIKKRMKKNLSLFKPVTMLVVPMLLQALRKEILVKIRRQNKQKEFARAVALNKKLSSLGINAAPRLFKEIYDSLGGNIRYLICGGAFLSMDIIKFYDDIGIKILEGYGMTECAPIVSCNSTKYVKAGSLGKVGPYCEVRIVDGEICVRGENVMLGYYKNPKLTSEVLRDGWLATGDIGYVDGNNFVYLTGRKKNLIILNNGENVNPETLENLMSDIELFHTVVVYGENDLICVEIYPNLAFAESNGITDIKAKAEEYIRTINEGLPMYSQIRSVRIREKPFEVTTTMKVKRFSLNHS